MTTCKRRWFVLSLFLLAAFSSALHAQTIATISPTSGIVGASVTVTGTGFSTMLANNTVYFGGVKATVSSASATSLTVTVPASAAYGPIRVTVGGLTAESKAFFLPTFAGVRGIAAGSFAAKIDSAQGSAALGVALADLDGDGKPDLASTSFTESSVLVRRNGSSVGTIGFEARSVAAVGANPNRLTAADIDGDGKLDLLVANGNSNTVSILRNASTSVGTISLEAAVGASVGTGPVGIAVGDIDGDGKLDVLTTNQDGRSVTVLRNTSTPGTASFDPAVNSSLTLSGNLRPFGIAVGDLDGDDKPDVVVGYQGGTEIAVLRNTSTAGSISFAAITSASMGTTPSDVTTGDVDGDGKLDVVVSNFGSNSVSVLRNISTVGSIGFAIKVDIAVGASPSPVALSDIDGDGKPDIVAGNFTSGAGTTVSLLRNASTVGSISFASKIDLTVGTGPRAIALADIDGDGKPDLATGNDNTSVSLLRNLGLPVPAITSISPTSGAPGTAVTVTGLNFDATPANNTVYFGGVKAVVTAASTTSLTVTVPASAAFGPIRVTVG